MPPAKKQPAKKSDEVPGYTSKGAKLLQNATKKARERGAPTITAKEAPKKKPGTSNDQAAAHAMKVTDRNNKTARAYAKYR